MIKRFEMGVWLVMKGQYIDTTLFIFTSLFKFDFTYRILFCIWLKFTLLLEYHSRKNSDLIELATLRSARITKNTDLNFPCYHLNSQKNPDRNKSTQMYRSQTRYCAKSEYRQNHNCQIKMTACKKKTTSRMRIPTMMVNRINELLILLPTLLSCSGQVSLNIPAEINSNSGV